MSTMEPTGENPTDGTDARRFAPTGAPAPMTDAKLARCRDRDGDEPDAAERAVFAVAHQAGVVQDDTREREYEAVSVLYLTADGEHACERWYAHPDGFDRVDRAFVVDASELEPTGEHARRFAPIVQHHPEVGVDRGDGIETDGGRPRDPERTCARCDDEAVAGSRFCSDHGRHPEV